MWTNRFKVGFTVAALFAYAVAHADTIARADEQSPQASPSAVYRIQPGDVLLVSVWREQDLQSEVLVRPDGGLSFPLAGEIQATGRTVEEVRVAISERIGKYVPGAVVTVTIKAIGGNRIYVIGKVNRPGEYPFTRPIDVMQALSLAGGTTPYAALNDIRVLRRENGRQTSISFRYADVERGHDLSQNIELRSGDTVVVP
jgi:polysaccharide biosynthesis/export protein